MLLVHWSCSLLCQPCPLTDGRPSAASKFNKSNAERCRLLLHTNQTSTNSLATAQTTNLSYPCTGTSPSVSLLVLVLVIPLQHLQFYQRPTTSDRSYNITTQTPKQRKHKSIGILRSEQQRSRVLTSWEVRSDSPLAFRPIDHSANGGIV